MCDDHVEAGEVGAQCRRHGRVHHDARQPVGVRARLQPDEGGACRVAGEPDPVAIDTWVVGQVVDQFGEEACVVERAIALFPGGGRSETERHDEADTPSRGLLQQAGVRRELVSRAGETVEQQECRRRGVGRRVGAGDEQLALESGMRTQRPPRPKSAVPCARARRRRRLGRDPGRGVGRCRCRSRGLGWGRGADRRANGGLTHRGRHGAR